MPEFIKELESESRLNSKDQKNDGLGYVSYSVGPYSPYFAGPLKINFQLDGEVIVKAEVERGFAHKGLESLIENRRWEQIIPLVSRLDLESSCYGELVFCLAIERLLELEIPKRAKLIRVVICELTRIACHLKFFSQVAQSVEAPTVVHYLLRDREKILDLFELLTGSRFSLSLFKVGGVTTDTTEGFLDRVMALTDLIQYRIKEYNDVFSFNYGFLRRSCGIGVLSQEVANSFGVTGSNLRASGMRYDVRKFRPYSAYDELEFSLPLGQGEYGIQGDCNDRYLVRLRELTESIQLIRQSCQAIRPGDCDSGFKIQDFQSVPAGEVYEEVESPRGTLGCLIQSSGQLGPRGFRFNVPSLGHIQALEEILVGERMENVALITSSMGISIPELDR